MNANDTFVIRSMTTTDYHFNSKQPVVPSHIYLKPAATRGSAWWTSSLAEAEKFPSEEAASDEIIRLGLVRGNDARWRSAPDVAPYDHRNFPTYWSKHERRAPTFPSVGDRARLKIAVGEYPLNPVPAGSLGTVVSVENDYVSIRLDELDVQLAEWNNELHVYADSSYGDATSPGLAATFSRLVDTLDSMCDELSVWCFRHGRPYHSADALLVHELDREPRDGEAVAWLEDFCLRWVAVDSKAA